MNRNLNADDAGRLYGESKKDGDKSATLLSGIDTEGLSKAQKKKLKAKLKK